MSAPLRQPQRIARFAGFTIIELMLTLLLLGVLVMVAMPFYNSYQLRVKNAQAVHDISAMSLAIQSYWNDNRTLPDSLADVQLSGKLDPWGTPYTYYNVQANGRGQARKDHALNPINTDFDLYSNGPDRASHSQITQSASLDDLIRASNGDFVGIAADF